MNAHRWNLNARRSGLAALLLTAGLTGLSLQGCNSGDPADISKGDTVRATLTAAAGALASTDTTATAAPTDAAAPEATPEAAGDLSATAEATAAGQLATPVGQGELPGQLEGLPKPLDEQMASDEALPKDPEGTAIAQRATAEATLGVANVNELVMSMPRLATFTPAPPAKVQGKVIYVRGGALWKAQPGSKPERLKLDEDLPTVWAPPQDPGRAWLSPDGKQLMLFAGADAEPWVTSIEGRNTRTIGGPALPVDVHEVGVSGGGSQTLRLKPGTNYTIISATGGEKPLLVVADILEDERRGYGRLRFVHAVGSKSGDQLEARVAGNVFGGPMKYGRSSGELRVPAGKVAAVIADATGKTLLDLGEINVENKEIKTVFLIDGAPLKAVPVVYKAGDTPGNGSQVRVFNAGAKPLTVLMDGKVKLSSDLAPAAIGPYARVNAILNTDQRSDIELAIYGNKTREFSVAWSPKSDRLVYLGAGDGSLDLYLSDLKGQPKRITQDAANQLNPVWSPDGGHVAWYSSEVNVILFSVQVAKADGSGIKTVDFAPIRQKLGLTPTDKLFFPQDVIWVDNDRFVLIPRTNDGPIGMWLYDVNKGTVSMLTDQKVHAVEWSAKAEAFLFTPDKDTGEVIRLGLDGKARSLVKGKAFYPIWSPDGSRISYVEGDPVSTEGWVLHIMDADGGNDRPLSPRWPLVQSEPPVPGPRAKRIWLDGGKTLVFSRVGSDYGAADRAGIGRLQSAGPDIENYYAIATDGKSAAPRQLTDLTQVFYLDDLRTAADGKAMAFVGLWYQSRTQQLWVAPSGGGKPVQIDGPVRWYAWAP
ncbi:MAG: hypothetical protein IPL60_13785 [Ardenticatenia bacterium]|nr:hypothetical protein [Ardenticatenia bacterium]